MKLTVLIFSLFFLITGCAVQKKTKSKSKIKNVAFLYNPSISKINIKHKIFHTSNEKSVLTVNLKTSDLLIKSEGSSKQAKILLKYRILINNEKLDFFDSLSTIYNINILKNRKKVSIEIPLNLSPNNYFIMLTIKDLYNNTVSETYFTTDKTNKFSADNFYAKSKKTNTLKFDNIVKSTDSLQLFYNREKADSFFVYYFKNTFKPSPPPFTLSLVKARDLIPDSIFTIANNDSTYLTFAKQGFYEVLTDTSQNQGITFFNFGNNFPLIKTPTQMLNPLAYLTSQTEFKKYKQMPNKKLAVDEFWLKASNNANSAKGLVRVYYNRVKFANIYFTSYKEGWKTDRGMIYIIYGAPSIINKSNKVERWIYSNQNSLMQFTFVNTPNTYTDNNFEVKHNEAYSIFWYKAIDTWRNGRIFSITQ